LTEAATSFSTVPSERCIKFPGWKMQVSHIRFWTWTFPSRKMLNRLRAIGNTLPNGSGHLDQKPEWPSSRTGQRPQGDLASLESSVEFRSMFADEGYRGFSLGRSTSIGAVAGLSISNRPVPEMTSGSADQVAGFALCAGYMRRSILWIAALMRHNRDFLRRTIPKRT
jgi:hypothetical protein